jgi:hypothetical protein
MAIPKTLIMGVFLHGELHITDNGEINMDTVPDGMCVNIINAVAPGIHNISTLKDYENMATRISKVVKKRKYYDELTNYQINKVVVNLRDMLVRENEDQSSDIFKLHQHLYCKNQVNVVFQKFTHQYGNSFNIKTYLANDKIPNKLFIKFSEREVINPDNIEEKYFNSIVLFNLDESDLFRMLVSVGLDIEQITLGQLLEFLVGFGVQNLIMVDLSCSTFKGKSEFLTERNIRLKRRKMLFN